MAEKVFSKDAGYVAPGAPLFLIIGDNQGLLSMGENPEIQQECK